MIGYVSNATLVCIEAAGAPTYRELIARARTAVLGAWSNCETPITEQVPHGLRRVNVNYAHVDEVTLGAAELAPGIRCTLLPTPATIATLATPFDLHLWLRDAADRTTIRLAYLPALFDDETVQRLVAQFIAVLGTMCAQPDAAT
jgi:hypothetical protein